MSIAPTKDAATWQAITTGLPDDSPVNTVREDPVRKGLLFAGTETAVWMSNDDGDHWRSLQYNLPHTSMRDLAIHDNDLIVATHGRSFWVLDDISVLRQLDGVKAQSGPALFKPGEAYRVRRSAYTDTPMPPDEPAGENPPDGAVIDYSLPASIEGAVTLEILDAKNNVVRRYSSTDKPELTQEEMEKQLIPLHWLRMPRILPGTAGMHRWVWDLRSTTPTATRHEYPISAVPHDTHARRGAARAARDLYGAAHSQWQDLDGFPDHQNGSPGQGAGGRSGGDVQTGVKSFGSCVAQRQGGSRGALGARADREAVKERLCRIEGYPREAAKRAFSSDEGRGEVLRPGRGTRPR
jgi:hypothetical protein